MANRTYTQLAARVAHYLGWGSAPFTADQDTRLSEIVESGLDQFYSPPIEYTWSFMQPVTTVTFDSAATTKSLGSAFGGMIGGDIYIVGSGYDEPKVEFTAIERVEEMLQRSPTHTGRPQYAAVRPRVMDNPPASTQLWEMVVYPKTDQSYMLRYKYRVVPEMITGSQYPYGSPGHGETILASCYAVAEMEMGDEKSIWQDKFMDRLRASINLDKGFRPRNLGPSLNLSDHHSDFLYRTRGITSITVGGVTVGSSGSTTVGKPYTDRLTMTGSDVSYTIPTNTTDIEFHALDGDITMSSTSGGDARTIREGSSVSLPGDSPTIDGEVLYFNGTSGVILEITYIASTS